MSAERGIVERVEPGWAWVKTKRSSACESCGSSHHCLTQGGDQMVVKAQNTVQAQKGDEVELYLRNPTQRHGDCLFASGPGNFGRCFFSRSAFRGPRLESFAGDGDFYDNRPNFSRFLDALSVKQNGFQTGTDPFGETGNNQCAIICA